MTVAQAEGGFGDDAESPIAIIDAFSDANEYFIKWVEVARQKPNYDTIAQAEVLAKMAGTSAKPLLDNIYFREQEQNVDDEPPVAVIGAIDTTLRSIDELISAINNLKPDSIALDPHQDMRGLAIDAITQGPHEEAVMMSKTLYQTHNSTVQSLLEAFMESEEVQGFLERKAKIERLKENAINFGGIVLASYIGSKLAGIKFKK